MKSSLQLLNFVAGDLELVIELSYLVGREPEVLLGASDFLSERGILGHQFLDFLSVGLTFLVVGGDSGFELVDFHVELLHLIG